jgi:hypothetical protein
MVRPPYGRGAGIAGICRKGSGGCGGGEAAPSRGVGVGTYCLGARCKEFFAVRLEGGKESTCGLWRTEVG